MAKASNRSASNRKKPKEEKESTSLFDRITDITTTAFRFAKRTTDGSIRVGKALINSQDQLKVMLAAGQSLKDLREVTGLTLSDLSDALNLRDKSLLEAVENGTATLSFELILRLASLLARNDPIPFVLRYTRTYNPELWKVLHDWGLGRIPLQYERERQFINIYRRHDAARRLSDEGFQHALKFTREAFEMALHFVAEQENLRPDEEPTPEEALAAELKKQAREASSKDKDSKSREKESRRTDDT
jgi:transcriptional regulator with XRE-family HTH domain